MQAEKGLHIVDKPGGDHLARAAFAFLRRLKDDLIGAAQLAAVRVKKPGCIDADGGVRIVPAAMHQPLMDGFVGEIGQLLHLECVRVKAQAHRPARTRAVHHGKGDVISRREQLDAVPVQDPAHTRVGAYLLMRGFRIAMQLFKERAHLRLKRLCV